MFSIANKILCQILSCQFRLYLGPFLQLLLEQFVFCLIELLNQIWSADSGSFSGLHITCNLSVYLLTLKRFFYARRHAVMSTFLSLFLLLIYNGILDQIFSLYGCGMSGLTSPTFQSGHHSVFLYKKY